MVVKSYSILHIPPNGVEVTDGEAISVRNSAGADPHVGHAVVSNGAITGINLQAATVCMVDDADTASLTGPDGSRTFGNITAKVSAGVLSSVTLPSGSSVITDQAGAINVQDADGTTVSCTAVIQPQTGFLSYVDVPGTAALVTNSLSVKMASYGGAGPVDGVMAITGGFINWVSLAKQTDVIVSDTFSTALGAIAVSPTTDFATLNVSAGSLQSVGVSLAPTKAVVTDAQELTIPVTGTYVSKATLTVSGGAVTAIVLS